ncbi:MAG: hypothetical protein J0M28_09200 [Thauera sp.]|nr:hypothetical protein [Thauera sp.]
MPKSVALFNQNSRLGANDVFAAVGSYYADGVFRSRQAALERPVITVRGASGTLGGDGGEAIHPPFEEFPHGGVKNSCIQEKIQKQSKNQKCIKMTCVA